MASSFNSLRSSRRQQLRVVDRRVRLITGILASIRQVKLFAYEEYFGRRILGHREKELARLRRRNREKAVLDTVTVSHPPVPEMRNTKHLALDSHTYAGDRSVFRYLLLYWWSSRHRHFLRIPTAFQRDSWSHS